MCGIYGLIQANGPTPAPALLTQMADAIGHRGPDHRGCHVAPGLALGNNRLAIIDPAHGNQPISTPDNRLTIVYNGELYNHPELRAELAGRGVTFRTGTDTETLLHAFATWGPECLPRLNGMFAFAVWDQANRRLFLAVDRLGVKPLYWCPLSGGGHAFASEAKALLPVVPGGARPDWTALHRYLGFGYVPANASPFAHITKFPPGCGAWLNGDDAPHPVRYFAPRYGHGPVRSLAEATAGVAEHLDGVVAKELMSDVPLGLLLSGGLDSSAVAASAAKQGGGLETFTLGFEEKTHDEGSDAHLVARHLGLPCRELRFSPALLLESLNQVAATLDEPFGDITVLPLHAIARFARQQVKVVLTGWGGDEIFAGYPTYRAHRLARLYRRLPRLLAVDMIPALVRRLPPSDRYLSLEFKAKRFVRGVELPQELQHFAWMGYLDETARGSLFTPRVLEQVRGAPMEPVTEALEQITETDLIDRILHLDALFFLRGNGLFQVDRMTMAASLEARVPLLNNTLSDYVNALPLAVRMPGGEPKGLLKRVLAGHLPPRILNKPKKGFGPPVSIWLRGPLLPAFRVGMAEEKLRTQGIFRVEVVKNMLDEHLSQRRDWGRELWAMLSMQLWYDRFITTSGDGAP